MGNGVSLIVPTWRRAAWLTKCLGALCNQTQPADEVFVVGRRSDLEAIDVVRAHHGETPFSLRWIEVTRAGHVAPVLAALKHVRHDKVAILDDDTEPVRTWLEFLVCALSSSEVACVGGRVITPGVDAKIRRGAGQLRWYGQFIGNVAAIDGKEPRPVDGVMECNWAWKTQILQGLYWDPVFDSDDGVMYGLCLCLQAKALGYRVIYEPRAKVLHHGAPRDPILDRENRAQRTFIYSRNYTYLALKHLPPARRAAFVAWSWLFGERHSYGLLSCGIDLITRRRPAWSLIKVGAAGRFSGMKLWRESKAKRYESSLGHGR